ncbi:ISNCY family transposase [Methylotuvimicrobium sp. KM2]|uniref:ISNCY family transposase n=1 Tax=Methylotuvimicrobium sp. KM2 TaxID=3133976 RepID=UPI0031013D84
MDLEIIDLIRRTFEDLPDSRKPGNNRKYRIEDAVLSALSVFFTQSPSFLDYQRRMDKFHNRNNAQSIFGVHQIPSTSQIGNLLDPIAPGTLYPVLAEVGGRLYTQGCLKPFVSVGVTLLVALDGTDSFSSEKISCPCCTQQTLKNGQILYRHTRVTPVIVAPGQSQVVPLPPEFVRVQDGVDKQDCELAAAKRWLTKWGAHYAPRGITVLGDDLYCHHPFCEAVRAQHMDFLFVCKPDSHVLLFEWLDDFTRTGEIQTLEKSRWNGKQRMTERYRYFNQVPLRNSDDALMVNKRAKIFRES